MNECIAGFDAGNCCIYKVKSKFNVMKGKKKKTKTVEAK